MSCSTSRGISYPRGQVCASVEVDKRIAGAEAVGAYKMSLLQDLERGRPMEMDPLIGSVQELWQIVEIPTPTIDAVLAFRRLRTGHST